MLVSGQIFHSNTRTDSSQDTDRRKADRTSAGHYVVGSQIWFILLFAPVASASSTPLPSLCVVCERKCAADFTTRVSLPLSAHMCDSPSSHMCVSNRFSPQELHLLYETVWILNLAPASCLSSYRIQFQLSTLCTPFPFLLWSKHTVLMFILIDPLLECWLQKSDPSVCVFPSLSFPASDKVFLSVHCSISSNNSRSFLLIV